MALLERRGEGAAIIEDRFERVEDGAALPDSRGVLVSLSRFLAEKDALLSRAGEIGVFLASNETASELEADLDRIALIALEFPVFSDGRAYSTARLLRERMGYKGELRAIGDVLCEQLTFMLRSGFDSFEMESPDACEEFAGVLREVRVVYQPTADGQRTAIDFRSDPSQSGQT
jgi:uncharacterized protein (DUF934 family)